MGRIAVTGSVAYDTIMVFPGHFGDHILSGQTHIINVSFQVTTIERRYGGTAANVCYTMALLGERPLLCAGVGNADFDEYAGHLERVGVETSSALRCQDVGTAAAFITTDLDNNQITAFYAGAMSHAAGVDLSALADISDVVVGADSADAMALHIHQARAMGARLTFAPAQQIPSLPDATLRDGLDSAWLVVGNDYEMEMIRKRLGIDANALRNRCVVAVTHGSEGSDLYTRDGILRIPASDVSGVIDPTGAGDAYSAGLLTGLRAGLLLEDAGRLAAVAAAFVVESRGPQGHRFSRPEFRQRFQASTGADLADSVLSVR